MTDFTCNIVPTSSDNKLQFEIHGNPEHGFDKTIVNAIRRMLLSSIDTYAFRTEYDNSDIVELSNQVAQGTVDKDLAAKVDAIASKLKIVR